MLLLILHLSLVQLGMIPQTAFGEESYLRGTPSSLPPSNQQQSCQQLDTQLAALESQTYSHSPSFYADPAMGSAIWTGMLWCPAWAYVGYAGLREQYQQTALSDTLGKIHELRQLKAQRHCYER
jgi:hypothetical protein